MHTDEFRPLNKSFLKPAENYFRENSVDPIGVSRLEKAEEKMLVSNLKTTKIKRFRDEFIVKSLFECWKKSSDEKRRLDENRARQVSIDFREFWFQDGFSGPFYSYFPLSKSSIDKREKEHRMAYRLQKRLVRSSREQPKELSDKTV